MYVYLCLLYLQQHNAQKKVAVQQEILQQNYLQPVQASFNVYKGRSLPNVSQITCGSIDLQVICCSGQLHCSTKILFSAVVFKNSDYLPILTVILEGSS